MAEEIYFWEGEWQANEPRLGLNRAFRFGDGLFETIRITEGKAPLWTQHLERLKQSALILKLDLPKNFTTTLNNILFDLLEKPAFRSSIFRIWIFRSGKGKYTPETNSASFVCKAETLPAQKNDNTQHGLIIDLCETVTLTADTLSNLKSLNSLIYVMAAIEKSEKGFDELLLRNQKGELVEGTSTNLFIVKKKAIYTPPLSSGALDGVMRKQIIQVAKRLGFSVSEESISQEALESADEVFLSNAVSGIQWVKAFRKRRYLHQLSNVLSSKLYSSAPKV